MELERAAATSHRMSRRMTIPALNDNNISVILTARGVQLFYASAVVILQNDFRSDDNEY